MILGVLENFSFPLEAEFVYNSQKGPKLINLKAIHFIYLFFTHLVKKLIMMIKELSRSRP